MNKTMLPNNQFAWHAIILMLLCIAQSFAADFSTTIDRIKPSIVAVGTYNSTDSPPFSMKGTGFVVGEGNLIATNAHVIPAVLDKETGATLAIQLKNASDELQLRQATLVIKDPDHDLALLRIEGTPLPKMVLRNSDNVREGYSIAFTGFPIGGSLGFSPVTHRGSISAITPIALPSPNSQQLNEKLIKRLKSGSFKIFQLDATAYPGNSGSPVFDVETGEVIGIINMVLIKGTKESALSQPSGISYALPANLLQELIRRSH